MSNLEPSVPPPSFLQLDDDNAIKPQSKRFARLSLFPHKHRRKEPSQEVLPVDIPDNSVEVADTASIRSFHVAANVPPGTHDSQQDQYQWAVLYENQRGLTIFSTPYYSRLSLLPNDPLPFTMPSADKRRSKQPRFNLANYPLPDGSWHWASKSWMVDMRGATGQVQHDGFEYNWLFRRHKWHASAKISNGSFVRRRRWLRLMVKPATSLETQDDSAADPDDTSHPRYDPSLPLHGEPSEGKDPFDIHPRAIILGESAEDDWKRCCALLQRAGRDGRKLELWHRWLGLKHLNYLSGVGKSSMERVHKQWSEDGEPMPSEVAAHEVHASHVPLSDPPIAQIGAMLRQHFANIMDLFIYPESRAHFVELIAFAGLLPHLLPDKPEDFGWLLEFIDFPSYIDSLFPSDTVRP
ncbi:hypothetical protein ONZ45_g18875 [Pleurotus djamor]|nr:hypothetical protein ONZ45_g18875 [Pleurotus djamor]